ncbi:unnamed protein product [Hapterophycus canaliculatus]
MELPAMASNVPQTPPLSPLALDDGNGLDGWDAAGEDFDFEDLFRDAEKAEEDMAVVDDTNNDSNDPAARVGDTGGGDGETSFIDMSDVEFERGLLSLAEATSTPAAGAAAAEFNTPVSEDDLLCSATGATAPNITASTTAWSSTSASEESDDGSRSSLCGSSSSSGAYGGIGGASVEAPRTSTSEADIMNNDAANSKKRVLAVSSGVGTPILPSFFAPTFGGGTGSTAAAAAALSALPGLNFGGLQAAAGEAWKRMRGGEEGPAGAAPGHGSVGSLEGGAGTAGSARLLSGGSGGGSSGHGRVNKRAKREERLMKNREAANRSRVKRKEVLSELENRADALSKSLAESRDEAASLKQEIASLREQNSFLRGMLSAQSSGPVDLPSVVPSLASPGTGQSFQQSRRSGPRGGSAAAAGASAIVGAVGTGLAVISCVALSAAGFGGGSFGGGDGGGVGYGYSGGSGGGSTHRSGGGEGWGGGSAYGGSRVTGGRRMLLSVGESEGDFFEHTNGETSFLFFGNGSAGGCLVVGLLVAVTFATVVLVARWAYHKEFARRRHVAVRRGRRGAVASRGAGAGRGGGFDFVGGLWPLDRLLGGDKPVRKAI